LRTKIRIMPAEPLALVRLDQAIEVSQRCVGMAARKHLTQCAPANAVVPHPGWRAGQQWGALAVHGASPHDALVQPFSVVIFADTDPAIR
jgi:hypothetical protein